MVWATSNRQPLITRAIQQKLYRCIGAEVVKCGGKVLAIGGMPDHVHLLLQIPATIAVADIARMVKGVSSTFARKELETQFKWQNNYAAFSISRSHIKRVVAYIANQEQHHTGGSVWKEWEETDEESVIASQA
jgi:REP element-mobilizing transposase RayT